jgi:peptide/nickel transport system substrate-binding protein
MPISFRPQALIALAGLAVLLAVLAVTATTRSANPEAIIKPAGAQGSTYVEAMVGAPRFINPLLATSDTDKDLTHLVFRGLTRVDERGEIAPDLASQWQISPDGRVYTFTLKPDLSWHDGEPLTSNDVYFTIGLLKSPDFPGDATLAALWRDVQMPVTTTQQTVQFTLSSPSASFLSVTSVGILPRHLWESVKPADMAASQLNLRAVGSGSWRIIDEGRRTKDEGVILEPYPASDGAISRLWFRLYPSFGAALDGFKGGEVHGLGHIPHDQLAEVASVPGVQLHKQALARYSMLLLNTRSPLLDRPETRQALELAIDREAIISQSLNGNARPAHSPILAQSWAYDATLPYRRYDPARARQLLDEAGWAVGAGGVRAREGVTMTVVLAANADIPTNVAVARQVGTYLREVGVDVQVALVPRDTLLNDYLRPRAYHIALASWEAQSADPDVFQYWHSSQANMTGGLNFSLWINSQADSALEAARLKTDRDERRREYSEFQKAFLQDVPAVVLYNPVYVYATGESVSGVTLPLTEMKDLAARFDSIRGWSLRP